MTDTWTAPYRVCTALPRKVPLFFATVFVVDFAAVAAFAVANPAGINEAAAPIPQMAALFTNLLDANSNSL